MTKVALVTGGTRGIGAAIAAELAGEGCDIAVVDRDPSGAESLREIVAKYDRRFAAYAADVAAFADAETIVARVVAESGRLDALVCNAGITRDAAVWKMAEADWDAVLSVNLKGVFNYCRAAGAHFREQQAGRIVAITSINGMRGKFGQANYAAAKAGIIGLTKTLARELGKYGVTANAIAPGMVRTEMAANLPAEIVATATAETAVKRLAEPNDIAAAVAFLCSDRARHITGEVIKVDGGQYI